MEFRRCLICEELYLGTERPSRCPHCGSAAEYLVPAAAWVDENLALGELSPVSRRNLERALQLEVDNDAFYGEARDKARVESLFPKVKKSYHALAKAENFDEAVSAEEPVDKKPKSIQEELKEKIQELMK